MLHTHCSGQNMAEWSKLAKRIRVPAGFAFAVAYFWLARPTSASFWQGSLLVMLGLVIRTLASGYVRKNEELATTGPYAHTRNPLYLGSLILAVGFAWVSQSWWILAGVVLMFFGIYFPVIKGEEQFLRERFSEFEHYSKAVPRIFPRFTAYKEGASKFSWALYQKHREYNALIGSAALLAIMAAKAWHKF
jgi:protein-S-isoprenylcysteine O-methyltransferase Ste14